MAKRQGKKQNSGDRNSARRNGKAPKKNPTIQTRDTLYHEVKPFKAKRNATRSNREPQKRNEFGHIIKWIEDHEVVICDHPKGYVHEKV